MYAFIRIYNKLDVEVISLDRFFSEEFGQRLRLDVISPSLIPKMSVEYLIAEVDKKNAKRLKFLNLAEFEEIFTPYLKTPVMQLLLRFTNMDYPIFKKEIYLRYGTYIEPTQGSIYVPHHYIWGDKYAYNCYCK